MKSTFNVLLFSLKIFGVFGKTNGVKFVSVMEGDSVTLNPNLTQLQEINKILWTFGAQRSTIGEIYRNYKLYTSNMMFVYRVKLNQNGSLTINSIRTRHSGLYIAKISHRTGTSYKKFSVVVYESPSVIDVGEAEIKSVSVKKGNPVTLKPLPDLFGSELILWGFGNEGILIAKCDAEATITSLYDAVDGKFRDRLHLHDTGALTIRFSRTTDSGLYKLKTISVSGITSYMKFNVTVREQTKKVKKLPPDLGLSSGAVICIIFAVLLVTIAAAVISHHCMVFDQRRQMRRSDPKTVSVMEGQHVTLVTDVVIENGEQVQWIFEGTMITTGINGNINMTSYGDDERFRDRLELHHQTADLLIKNIKPSDAGVYQLQITSSSGKAICRKYNIVVSGNRSELSADVVQSEVQSILMV